MSSRIRSTRRSFSDLPSLGTAFLRALIVRKRRPSDASAVPRLEAELVQWRAPEGLLDRYRHACSLSARVPITWFQRVATPLHVELLTAPEFPLRATGLVHPRVRIAQHAAIDPSAAVDIVVAVGPGRDVHNGIEFDLETKVYAGGSLVWESVAATFARTQAVKRTTESPPEAAEPWIRAVAVSLPANAGRRYARVSGDANPVHLHPLTARLFGYRRPIAHGWWLLARALGALGLDGPAPPTEIEAKFLRPAWLPSTAEARVRTVEDRTEFALVDLGDGKPRLEGVLRSR